MPEMISLAGGQDVCGIQKEAVCISEESLEDKQPDIFIFALCGLNLEQSVKSAQSVVQRLGGAEGLWGRLPAVQRGIVAVVDGEKILSRPGPRLVQSMEVLVELLHPEAQKYGHQGRLWQHLLQA